MSGSSCFSSPWDRRYHPRNKSVSKKCLSSSWAASHLGSWFLSEPGYYEDGAFGIRIENVVLVVPVKTKVSNYVVIYF